MLTSPARKEIRSWTTDSRRWSRYVPRAGDVIVCTPPKTGTTWTQRIVSLLIFQSAEARPIIQTAPWLDARFHPLDDCLTTLEQQTHRRSIKTHLPFDAIPVYDEVKYIHVGRDGRDVLMSWHNHCSKYTESTLSGLDAIGAEDETIGLPYPRAARDAREFFGDWMTEGEEGLRRDNFPASRFFEIEKSYWAKRREPNLLIVHYADMKADLSGEMHRIADFLDIAVSADIWPALVEAATFETMKKDGAALLPTASTRWDGGPDGFLFSGTNGRWRDALSPDDNARYEARVRKDLSPGLAHWLENGRHVAGDPRTIPD
jgi:aryl sulfotransferase